MFFTFFVIKPNMFFRFLVIKPKVFLYKNTADSIKHKKRPCIFDTRSFNLAVGGGVEPPTERLAIVQYIKWSTLALVLYTTFISDSPPPRQEGMSASFNILQYNHSLSADNNTKVIDRLIYYKYYYK